MQVVQLDASGGLLFSHYQPFQGDNAFNGNVGFDQRGDLCVCLADCLYLAPAIADDQEINATHLTKSLQPAFDAHTLTTELFDFCCSYTFHWEAPSYL